ncbi:MULTISPECIES: hypothetical protein [unclassified Streptomyces]|uniref:hypothetical protein n=1 Tax=unclassified Streptomyces TaxID=2593676 RepID=UPI0018FE4867|nr:MULTISPECIES: hypothetical protein [unclassified Streptomyces]
MRRTSPRCWDHRFRGMAKRSCRRHRHHRVIRSAADFDTPNSGASCRIVKFVRQ